MRETLKRLCHRYGRSVGILFALYVFAALTLLRADFYFRDDLRRAAIGFRGWGIGRYLSLAGSLILHTDTYLADIAPLPQLLALLFLAIAAVALRTLFAGNEKIRWWEYGALFPLAFFPYFLNCLSYRYDAPYMALSVGVSIAPLLFWSGSREGASLKCRSSLLQTLVKNRRYEWAVFFGTLAMCMLYQASSGIFPVLVLFLALWDWLELGEERGRASLAFLLRSALPYGLSMVFFRLFIMKPLDDYVSTELPEGGSLVSTALANYRAYFSYFFSDMRLLWLVGMALVTLCFLATALFGTKKRKVSALLLTVLVLAVLAPLSLGAYPLLAKPLFLPRAMYGLGFPFTLMGLGLCAVRGEGGSRRAARAGALAVLALSFCYLSFSFAYGNALKVQAKYTEDRILLALADLNDLPEFTDETEKVMELAGDIGFSPVIDAMPEDYRLLRRLVPHTLGGGTMWRQYGFFHYYGLKHVTQDSTLNWKKLKLPVVKETMYHTIQGDGTRYLVTFH